MNATLANQIHREMVEACAAVAARHNITIKSAGGRFSHGGSALLKFEVATIGANGVENDKPRTDFPIYAFRYGLKASDLDREINYGGVKYRVAGCYPRKSRCNVLVKPVTGSSRGLLLPGDVVAKLLLA